MRTRSYTPPRNFNIFKIFTRHDFLTAYIYCKNLKGKGIIPIETIKQIMIILIIRCGIEKPTKNSREKLISSSIYLLKFSLNKISCIDVRKNY